MLGGRWFVIILMTSSEARKYVTSMVNANSSCQKKSMQGSTGKSLETLCNGINDEINVPIIGVDQRDIEN